MNDCDLSFLTLKMKAKQTIFTIVMSAILFGIAGLLFYAISGLIRTEDSTRLGEELLSYAAVLSLVFATIKIFFVFGYNYISDNNKYANYFIMGMSVIALLVNPVLIGLGYHNLKDANNDWTGYNENQKTLILIALGLSILPVFVFTFGLLSGLANGEGSTSNYRSRSRFEREITGSYDIARSSEAPKPLVKQRVSEPVKPHTPSKESLPLPPPQPSSGSFAVRKDDKVGEKTNTPFAMPIKIASPSNNIDVEVGDTSLIEQRALDYEIYKATLKDKISFPKEKSKTYSSENSKDIKVMTYNTEMMSSGKCKDPAANCIDKLNAIVEKYDVVFLQDTDKSLLDESRALAPDFRKYSESTNNLVMINTSSLRKLGGGDAKIVERNGYLRVEIGDYYLYNCDIKGKHFIDVVTEISGEAKQDRKNYIAGCSFDSAIMGGGLTKILRNAGANHTNFHLTTYYPEGSSKGENRNIIFTDLLVKGESKLELKGAGVSKHTLPLVAAVGPQE